MGATRAEGEFLLIYDVIYYVILDAAVVGINPGTPGVEEETVGHHVTNGKSVSRVVLRNDFCVYDVIKVRMT